MIKPPVALIIGIANYMIKPLSNSVNDANDIALCLESLGFHVFKKIDCTKKEMEIALDEFNRYVFENQADVGLFFFAGHGIQIEGKNYLIASDSDAKNEIELEHSSLSLDKLIKKMDKAQTPVKIIILDACRNNPYENTLVRSTTTQGLAPINAPKGTFIAYATSPGQIARDGKNKKNGEYTDSILQHVRTPDLSIEDMFKRVRNTLSVATKGKQISWEHTSLSGDFFFNLSLGTRIDLYKTTSFNDSLFVIDKSRLSHRLIAELKTLNWYRQHPAIEQIIEKSDKFTINSLFVIGRNIYQSACGNSTNAKNYIDKFMIHAQHLSPAKRKAILDGILFEIFFDSKGRLRETFKVECFNKVFDLQRYTELTDSFKFIAECLNSSSYKFYSIPGKEIKISINVEIKRNNKNEDCIEGIFVGTNNVLRPETNEAVDNSGLPTKYKTLDRTELEETISLQMLVPQHLLTITYTPSIHQSNTIKFPRDWTARKC